MMASPGRTAAPCNPRRARLKPIGALLMNITILGAGNVGRALGLGFARADHIVAFGVRNPAEPRHADLAATKGVRVVRLLPLARVVKAFNTIGFNVMANPIFGTQRALMYIAGN